MAMTFDYPGTFRITATTTAQAITVPASAGTVQLYNATTSSVAFVEVNGTSAVVPTAGGAPGSMPLLGGAGSIPLLLEKGRATTISVVTLAGTADLYITIGYYAGSWTSARTILAAALDLSFLNGTLDPRITFTNAGPTWNFGSDGRLVQQGYNLLKYSQDQTNAAAWSSSLISATGNSATAPDGTNTATLLSISNQASAGQYQGAVTVVASTQYTFSNYYKLGTLQLTDIKLAFYNESTPGFITTDVVPTLTPVGNGWYRGVATVTTPAGCTALRCYVMRNALTLTGTLYTWGAQLELGSTASLYSPTTSSANSAPRFAYDPATPAGTTGAEFATQTPTDASYGYTQPTSGSVSTVNGSTRVYSADGSIAQFQPNSVAFFTSVSPVLGRTYKLTFTLSVTTGTCLVQASTSATTVGSFSSSGTYSVYVTAADITVLFLMKRQSGVTDFTVSKISVQEVTFIPLGLLIEESRQNVLLWNRDLTNAAWSKVNSTATLDQVGIDGAANSASKVHETTATGVHAAGTATVIVPASTACTFHAFVKAAERGYAGLQINDGTSTNNAWCCFNLTTGAVTVAPTLLGGTLTNMAAKAIQVAGGYWWLQFTVTLNTNANALGYVLASPDGTTYSYTGTAGSGVIVDAAGLEVGSFATSPILNTSVAQTRAAAVDSSTASIPGATGTVVIEAIAANVLPAAAQTLYSIDDGSSNNLLQIYRLPSGQIRAQWIVAGVTQATLTSVASIANGVSFKVAVSWAANDFSLSLNGATPVTAASGTIPTVTTRRNGMAVGNAYLWNGTIKRETEYATRLPNATLQALST